MSEIGDLAMAMLRRYPAALLVGFATGAVGWAIANAILLSWIPIRESTYGLEDEEAVGEVFRYVAWMAILVILQTPAAGVLTTLYLGQAVFEQRPTWQSVLREARRQFRSWFWVLGVKRLAIPTMILLALRWGQPASAFWDAFLPIVILFVAVAIRGARPFVPEILLLEQCPVRSDSDSLITLAVRSRSLHTPMAGDLGGRLLTLGFVFAGLTLCVLYTLMAIRGVLLLQWNFLDLIVLLVLYPLSLWTVAGISVVVRLLSYLDTRIRLEGWEVELAVRAEAMRQFGDEPTAAPSANGNARQQLTGAKESARIGATKIGGDAQRSSVAEAAR
jgi:hypothetical protein